MLQEHYPTLPSLWLKHLLMGASVNVGCMYKPLPSQLKIVSELNSLCSSLTESANFNGKKIENLKGSLKKATDTNKELKNTITSMNNRPKTINQDLENQSKCPFSV